LPAVVAFRIIWRNVSELFGVVAALRRNASQTVAATNMTAIHKQNQIFTLSSEQLSVLMKRRLFFHVGPGILKASSEQLTENPTLQDARSDFRRAEQTVSTL
jgi:hypothetical protein